MRKSKNWFTWIKKRPKQNANHDNITINENSRKSQKNNYRKGSLANYWHYLMTGLKAPFSDHKASSPHPYYGLWTLLLISIFNSISITATSNHFISTYQWFANISILPGLSFRFIAWLFAIQVFFFLLISLWLLPAFIYVIKNKLFQEETDLTLWLSEFYSHNVLLVFLSALALIMSLLAPYVFFIVVIFLLLLQIGILLMTTVMTLLLYQDQVKLPIFYWILVVFIVYLVTEIILINLIF
ncbi:hypothetical protein [Aerococcus kribbianus]|uniref:Uncharacterized protein n=1 Tax=Aerococcus kribbianus TaxID=2999064 RepID=A0A9X3FNU4_9LACT|nr:MULTISPECIES: hypothetical protein [unclassified Aerococcus]MCZ0716986.1 hypothetical protein [Aerococcus sp. YH-aer221]MCZ0725274.1 hypothetical protein [Aerococcus sp. YH-aer222]